MESGIGLHRGRYLFTEQAQTLIDHLNKLGQRQKSFHISLRGAKGVGKSTALLFLASICTRSWVFVSSRSPDLEVSFVKVVTQSTNNGIPPPTKICKPNQDALLFKTPEVPRTSPTTSERTPLSENLTETPVHCYPTTSEDLIPISEEPKEKVKVTLESLSSLLRSTPDMCLFVDLSEWRDCTPEKKALQQQFLTVLRVCLYGDNPTVVEYSAGHEYGSPRYMTSIKVALSSIYWKPFSKEEIEMYKGDLDFACSEVSTDDLMKLTCGNPKLIRHCSALSTIDSMNADISEIVGEYVDLLLNEEDIKIWLSTELLPTYNVLSLVAEGKPIQQHVYGQTWGWRHGLMYEDSSDLTGHILKFSYPSLLFHIFSTVRRKYTGELPAHVHGFFFEFHVLETLKRLNLTYVKENNSETEFEIDFDVASRLTEEPRAPLQCGYLYHLPYKTNAIDAVGSFIHNKTHWLLVLQVSLSPYASHKSKAGDAVSKIAVYTEMTSPKPEKTMYVYISPIPCSPADLIDHGVRTRTNDLYLGVTRVDSLMDKTIKYILKNTKIIDSDIKK